MPLSLLAQLPTVASGTVKRYENFQSQYAKPRHVDVWLPAAYEQNKHKRYAVLYMHDGQMLFDSNTTWNKQEWGVDETLSQLLKAGKIKDCIVVGIWNTDLRASEYLPKKPFNRLPEARKEVFKKERKVTDALSDLYLECLVKEIKPTIDKEYRTKPEAASTFVAGSSMGGLISLYALCEYPSVFGGAACLSTHWLGASLEDNTDFREAYQSYLLERLPTQKSKKIYFDYGTKTLDAFYEPHQKEIDKMMRQIAFPSKNWISRKFEGTDHSEKAWRDRLAIPIQFLLSKK